MPKILLPITIDRWRSPIATLLRTCVIYNQDIDFYSFSSPQTDEDRIKGEDFWSLPNIRKCNEFIVLQNRFDLVHIASHTRKNLAAGTLAKIRGIFHTQFLYTINLELHEDDRDTMIYKWFSAVVDHYVSVSHVASKFVRIDAPHCYHGVIPNGYDSVYFDPEAECNDAIPDDIASLFGKPYVLNVASLEFRKHPEWIVALARANPDMTFVMAGWVPPGIGEPFLDDVLACGLKNLIWLGHVTRSSIRALLKHASAFAFPSEREGLPLAVIEAMGMGVPVVAQPKSSMPELIVSTQCGCLIDIDRPDSLAEWGAALRHYITMGEDQRGDFRRRLSLQAKSRYSWQEIGHSYAKLYRKILAKNHD